MEFKQDFLEPEDAFKTNFTKNEDSLNFKLDLGDSIYLYDDKLQVFITKPQSINITEDVNIVEPVTYEEFIVHFTNQSIDIPFALLKSNGVDFPPLYLSCSNSNEMRDASDVLPAAVYFSRAANAL